MNNLGINNILHRSDTYVILNKHRYLLNNILKKYNHLCELPELQKQILDWAAFVLSEERKEWAEARVNSVEVLCLRDKREEACKRAEAKNKRYEPFKKAFKQLQKTQFEKYKKAGKILSANAFVKWFHENKTSSIVIPYLESNQTNQLIKLAQINNREFKKLLNAEADTSLTVED